MQQAAAGAAGGVIEPVGIDFDGTNDYLSRSSDLVGNADGKTFTFSCWYYQAVQSAQRFYISDDGSDYGIQIGCDNAQGVLRILAENSSGTGILTAISSTGTFSADTFAHILISIDLENASNRYIYVNDVDVTSNFTFSTYTNSAIDNTKPNHFIGAGFGGGGALTKGRLAGVYLDYTYRDLSVEANRRLFIDADGRYVTPPTTGIISVPMDDPDDPARNDGTGGDFTLNGVVAQSGRGPNQYNAAASTFDTTADYLSSTSITGLSDGKTGTIVFTVKPQENDNHYIFDAYTGGTSHFTVAASVNGGYYQIRGYTSGTVEILRIRSSISPVIGKYHTVAVTWDLANVSNRRLLINGVEDTSATYTIYTDNTIDYTRSNYNVNANQGLAQTLMQLSDLWFDDSYTADLSGFYDTETDKPKFLGTTGELPTGSAPLVYLPLYASSAGTNLGTGGDFTVNSGPYVGARGPSEFWGEAAEFNGTNQSLSRFNSGSNAIVGITNGKSFSVAMAFRTDTRLNDEAFIAQSDGGSGGKGVRVDYFSTTTLDIQAGNAAGTNILRATSTVSLDDTNWHILLASFDLSNVSKRHLFLDGVSDLSVITYTDDTIAFDVDRFTIGAGVGGADFLDGKIGFLWFNTEYVDFSQEANRLKFFDAFGYPVDLGEDGSLPTGNQPLIYLNEGFHLGTNLGSGGNFTPVNAPTDGGYVKG
jgi:hypothetical protein